MTARTAGHPGVAAVRVLRRIAADVAVLADGTVQVTAQTFRPPDAAPAGWAAALLARVVYRRYYLGLADTSVPAEAGGADGRPVFARENPALGAALRRASGSRYQWEPGRALPPEPARPDRLLVTCRGLTLHVAPEEIRRDRGRVLVRFPAERPFASPGFFLVCGSHGAATGAGLARWYLDVTPDAAPDLLAGLVTALDAAAVPFTFKVLNDPASYPRPDAAVLYLGRDALALADDTIRALRARLRGGFRSAVPAFTRHVSPGVALAEDPPQDSGPVSFGQHRCRLIARSLLDAGPDAGPAARLSAMLAAFAAAGISLDAPHLNPGSPEFALPERHR